MSAKTIEDVLGRLGEIVDWSRREASPAGYFAALYERVTRTIQSDIEAGRFDDPVRMEQLDVVFANRYLDAFDAWRRRAGLSACWAVAFRECGSRWPIVLQHLLGGINAHINLDLGIAVAEVAPGSALASFRGDFDRINAVLEGMVGDVKAELTAVWPPLRLLDWLAGSGDDRIIGFSLGVARREAWRLAEDLAPRAPEERMPLIRHRDHVAMHLARRLVYGPGPVARAALLGVRCTERGDVRSKLAILAGEGA